MVGGVSGRQGRGQSVGPPWEGTHLCPLGEFNAAVRGGESECEMDHLFQIFLGNF